MVLFEGKTPTASVECGSSSDSLVWGFIHPKVVQDTFWWTLSSLLWWCVNLSRSIALVCKRLPHSQKVQKDVDRRKWSDQCWSDQWDISPTCKWGTPWGYNPLILSIDPIFAATSYINHPTCTRDRVFSHPQKHKPQLWFWQLIFFMTENFRSLKNQRWLNG